MKSPSSSAKPNVDNILDLVQKFQPSMSSFYNILIFGEAGVGKSSLINLLSSVMTGSVTQVARVKDEEEDHTTVSFERHALTDSIALFDTWGWSVDHANYRNDEYRAMLQGYLPVGHHMEHSRFERREEQELLPEDLAADAVLFVIDASTDDDDRIARTVTEMGRFLQQAKAQPRVGPISFVLTKVDKIKGLGDVVTDHNIGSAMSKIGRNARVNEVIRIIKKNLPGDMKGRITFSKVINLEINETFVSPVIDFNIRNVLLELFKPVFQQTGTASAAAAGSSITPRSTPVQWNSFDFFDGETPRIVSGRV